MLSDKSRRVPWTIAIDNQKRQNFCISYDDCPGWKVKPIGSKKVRICNEYAIYIIQFLSVKLEL